jgi:hypothetical protein
MVELFPRFPVRRVGRPDPPLTHGGATALSSAIKGSTIPAVGVCALGAGGT